MRILAVLLLTLLFCAPLAHAETLTGPNYSVENPQLDSGGELSNSANYTSGASIGDQSGEESASTNYKSFWGFLLQSYPGVPGQPTFINTGGTLYDSLDFVIITGDGQQSDTNYAIAISSDGFTTTSYVQADDTVGPSEVWQDYIAWGSGVGQRITGLASGTTYEIKVKARYGPDSESGFSQSASAATVNAGLTVSISGISLGTTIAGETTTISTSSTSMSFSTLPVGSAVVAAQSVTVTTNSSGGYTTTLQQDGNLRKSNGDQIAAVTPGTNATPAIWPVTISAGEFGYHTTDSNLCTGTVGRFSSNNTYAAATTTPLEIACDTGPVTADVTTIVYKLQIGTIQQSGTYTNSILYISTAIF